jgi:hypothetical protein
MLRFKWFFSFLNFPIVEDGGGSEDVATVDEPVEVAQSPEEAVLADLGLDDGATANPSEGKPEEAATSVDEKPVEAAPAEDVEKPAEGTEKNPETLTDADLAPLDSKNPKTNERFQKVTEGYKQEKQRADTLAADNQRLNESFDAFRQLGYSDEYAAHDLVNFAEYRKAIYSGDEKAFQQIISEQLKQFETAHGKRVSISASTLDDFPDLKEKVEALELDEDLAHEVARNRKIQERANRDNEIRGQQQHSQQQQQEELQKSFYSVETMQANWQKNDPDFSAILPHLRSQMEEIGANYPPAMWPKLLDMQYKSLKKALSEYRQVRVDDTPLRGNGHQGGRPAPSSPQEAVLQELGLDGE